MVFIVYAHVKASPVRASALTVLADIDRRRRALSEQLALRSQLQHTRQHYRTHFPHSNGSFVEGYELAEVFRNFC